MPNLIGEGGRTVNAASLQAALATQAQRQIDGMLARYFGTVPELAPFDPEALKELGHWVI